jgi:hypothetical protein
MAADQQAVATLEVAAGPELDAGVGLVERESPGRGRRVRDASHLRTQLHPPCLRRARCRWCRLALLF